VENASGLSALLCLYHSHARVKSQDNQGSACHNGGPKSDVEGVGSQIMVSRSQGEFRLGRPSASEGVADKAAQDVAFATFCYKCLRRHADGDWGDISVGGQDPQRARHQRRITHSLSIHAEGLAKDLDHNRGRQICHQDPLSARVPGRILLGHVAHKAIPGCQFEILQSRYLCLEEV